MSSNSIMTVSNSTRIAPSLKDSLAKLTLEQIDGLLHEIHLVRDHRQEHAAPSMQLVKNKISKKKKKTKRAVASTSAKRPLNSWMAFRTYYSTILSESQQKDISRVMSKLWQEDPFRSKWSILAKAYSTIRDYKGAFQPELEEFLSLCCPYVGIISPQEYFAKLGWAFEEINSEVSIVRKFVPNMNNFDDNIRNVALSIDDILSYCYEKGFVDTDKMHLLGTSCLTMAVPATRAAHNSPDNSSSTDMIYATAKPGHNYSNAGANPHSAQFTDFGSPVNLNNTEFDGISADIINSVNLATNQYGQIQTNSLLSAVIDTNGLSSENMNLINFGKLELPALGDPKTDDRMMDEPFSTNNFESDFLDEWIFDPLSGDNFKAFTFWEEFFDFDQEDGGEANIG